MQVINVRGSKRRNTKKQRESFIIVWLQQWKCCSFPMGEKEEKGTPAKFNSFTTAGP